MHFLTYPRTGVNFIVEAIKLQTGVTIKYSHEEFIETNDLLINIVRDPVESIASWISMSIFRNDLVVKNNSVEDCVKMIAKPKYIKMYNFLLSRDNTIFIDYKDMLNIDKLIKKLCNILDIKTINHVNFEEINQRNIDRSNLNNVNYLITSKNQPDYLQIYEELKVIDLSSLYDLYHKALDKCIKI